MTAGFAGVAFTLSSERAKVLLEARFHTSLDRIAAISSQEFLHHVGA